MNVIKSYIVTNAAASQGGGGSGSVTSFSAGNLSPLFTTSVATATTTPALTFALVNQNANLVYAGPTNGAAAAPTFRALVAADLPSDSGAYWKTAGDTLLTNDVNVDGAFNLTFGANTELTSFVSTAESITFASTAPGSGIVLIAAGTINLTGTAAISILSPGVVSLAYDDGSIPNSIALGPAGVTVTLSDNQIFAAQADYSSDYTDLSYTSRGYVLGAKTYTGQQTYSLTSLFANNAGIDVVATGGSDVLNIGTNNADIINIGYSGSTINITGTLAYQNVTNLQVTDKLFTVNKGGGAGSGVSSGFEIEENAIITGYFATNGTRDGWDFKTPAITGVATLSLASLTGNHTYTLPDANGTFAVSASGNIDLSAAGNITLTGIVGPTNGGTGVANNAASTITISGNFATTFTVTATTGVTLPTTGTLATLAGAEVLTNKDLSTGTSWTVAPTITDGLRIVFNPNGTNAGINTGTNAGDPSGRINSDLWYNTSTGSLNTGKLNTTHSIITSPSLTSTANQIPFITGTANSVTYSTNLTFVTNRLIGTTLYLTLSAGTATAGTAPLVMTSGTNLTAAISGAVEYNNTFHMTNSDATRRHVVLAPNTTKVTAGAPYANSGYVVMNIGGTDFNVMVTG